MNRKKIIQLRLYNQGLSADRFEKPAEVVAHFGAMQAQDYSMALWAVGLRLKKTNRSAIENLVHSGEIIRTHILRPTWHLVHQKDIRWMMELYNAFPDKKRFFDFTQSKEMGSIDKLSGSTLFKQQIIAGTSEEEIRKTWEPGLRNFKVMRKKYLLYP